MLNPFFQQGSKTEQSLIQDLINEQLRMYGVEVYYIPRKYATTNTIIREVVESKFDDAYPLEAYVNTYEGYDGQGTILSKFGVQPIDDLTLTISKERFEEYITPLTKNLPDIELATRPKEGDLIYFPLSDNVFEVKFVEHESPFYQFGKLYTYKLKCELFEYSNEVTGEGIFATQEDEGFIVKYYYDESTLSGSPEVGELVTGSITGLTARINSWNPNMKYIELRAPTGSTEHGQFQVGETLTGSDSGFSINISSFDELDMKDTYADNIEFETEGDDILDFTERNPFGEFGNRS